MRKKPVIDDAHLLTHTTLKRLYRRMQMRGVRMLQIARKGKHNSSLLYRAYTWEEACRMLEKEITVIECQTKKITQASTLTSSKN